MLFLFQGCLRLSFKKWTGLQDCKNTYLVNPVLPGATQIHIQAKEVIRNVHPIGVVIK